MDELAERIKASLENPNGKPWFPERTEELAAWAWESLHRDLGLAPDSYSTERVLSRNISAPREMITCLKICPSACATAEAIAIEALTPESAIKYREQGISFYSADEILDIPILSCLEDALAIINQVPSLMRTVAFLVRSLHVIQPEDADYDVSFSEPHVPFSIFVSVPERRIANDALRVAEAIVHEAMHLQLTIIEQLIPLARLTKEEHFSPWRATHRSAPGLLHALYVFRVIDRFLGGLFSLGSFQVEVREHLEKRRHEINVQIQVIRSFGNSSALTITGAQFVRALLAFSDPSTHPSIAASLTS